MSAGNISVHSNPIELLNEDLIRVLKRTANMSMNSCGIYRDSYYLQTAEWAILAIEKMGDDATKERNVLDSYGHMSFGRTANMSMNNCDIYRDSHYLQTAEWAADEIKKMGDDATDFEKNALRCYGYMGSRRVGIC